MLLLQQLHNQECKLMQQQLGSYGQSTPQIKKWTFCQGRFSQGWLMMMVMAITGEQARGANMAMHRMHHVEVPTRKLK